MIYTVNLCDSQREMQTHPKMTLLIYFTLILSTATGKDSWFSLQKRARVYGTTLVLVSPSTLVSCFNICMKDFKCKSISLNKSNKICETFTDSVLHGDTRSDSGWETYGNYLHDSELVNIKISRYFNDLFFIIIIIIIIIISETNILASLTKWISNL